MENMYVCNWKNIKEKNDLVNVFWGCCSCRDPTQKLSSNSRRLFVVTYYIQNSNVTKISQLKNLVNL